MMESVYDQKGKRVLPHEKRGADVGGRREREEANVWTGWESVVPGRSIRHQGSRGRLEYGIYTSLSRIFLETEILRATLRVNGQTAADSGSGDSLVDRCSKILEHVTICKEMLRLHFVD
jgi:hypothetical protein